jgi:hypothetical protein
MVQGLFAQAVDEVMANILLHHFLWYRRQPPARGPRPHENPGLYSGDLAAFYSPHPVPIDLGVGRRYFRDVPAAAVWDGSFASETTTRWPENDRVRYRHWLSTAPDTGVTVVGVDGIVQIGTRWFRRLAGVLNARGIDVLTMDSPFNYRRTPRGYRPGQLITSGNLGHQLAVAQQGVLDLWKVIISLQDQGRRVGLVGVSYGGWLTLLTSLLVERLEFAIALVPPVDIVAMLKRGGGTVVRSIRRGIGYDRLDLGELERVARPIVPSRWPSRLDGNRIMLHAARFDRLVPCTGVTDLARLWNARLTMHDAAHYSLAVSTKIFPQVADQVCSML